ncbi:MAG: nicotinate (nicotinamide) nucleotide adenylyltransferase [Lachnospiraceae bacterium]|nr:nicotinate (nicotinamide) nucleotide adenylyltransferase [Lachnospiraceae bacterium]
MSGEKKHIAVVGGTFDPIHFGHFELGRAALSALYLDEVWFMPSGSNNYRSVMGKRAEKRHREAMVKLAIAGEKKFVYSDWECAQAGSTYTSRTFAQLNAIYPEVAWYYVVGADTLNSLKYWEEPELICNSVVLLVAGRREQVGDRTLQETAQALRDNYGADIRFIPWEDIPVSSTQVRQRFLEGKLERADLPTGVFAYVKAHHLYRSLDSLTDQEILDRCDATTEERGYYERLTTLLTPRRARHCLGVMHMAMLLADGYRNVSIEQARLAGLLHDCGRTENNALNALGHAPAGAQLARSLFGVSDEAVLSAIRWHTTGRPGMTELEKIIFVADYIEPFRGQMLDLDKARRIAYTDLDQAVTFMGESTIRYLESRGEDIDPITLETVSYYRGQLRKP